MRSRSSYLVVWLFLSAAILSAQAASNGVLDLTALANYANQPVPNYITKDNAPLNNPVTDRGATLGRVLFHDKRLSRDNTISCSSCHQQAHAFGDTATASNGVAGTTSRHTMRLVNARFGTEPSFFWDQRATSLENQTTQPIQNHVEMGFSGTSGDPAFAALVIKLSAIVEYRVLFAMTFGDSVITEARVQLALAQFVRSIQSFDSRFDLGRAQAGNNANFPNFTTQENNGKQLFLGAAGCNACHRMPEFDIDPNSRNNGVITAIGGGTDLTNTRAPSLRDLVGIGGSSNGPFMHDGSKATLASVIDHYNQIPGNNANLDPRLRRQGGVPQNLNLSQQQKNDLVAFLQTLTGSAVYTDARWSDPFDPQGQLALIVLPASDIRIEDRGDGTARISTTAAAGLSYLLQSSTDLQSWSDVAVVTPSGSGVCEVLVNVAGGGNRFFRYAFVPPAQ